MPEARGRRKHTCYGQNMAASALEFKTVAAFRIGEVTAFRGQRRRRAALTGGEQTETVTDLSGRPAAMPGQPNRPYGDRPVRLPWP
jgi:hypothetical protein